MYESNEILDNIYYYDNEEYPEDAKSWYYDDDLGMSITPLDIDFE